jgi:cysteine synthase
VCAALGHPLIVTMSAGNSPQRARMLESLGAEVVIVPQVAGEPGQVTGPDIAAAARVAEMIAAGRNGFYVDQFHALEGKSAHETGTAQELLDAAGGLIDGWTACVGTGCTFLGVARALRRNNPRVVCGAVEPAGCQVLAGKAITKAKHLLQGAGYGSVPAMWEPELMSCSIAVSDDEATVWKQRLATEEGLHVGFTAAATVCAASKILSSGGLAPEATVATVLCDTGLKY